MSVLLINQLPIDILKIIESFLLKYDRNIHTWEKLIKDGNLKGSFRDG